jgi:17beta-estradiol 17-dehydrogenase / very-long-chain 3-oxoacyl-CoA reductase
MSVVQWSVSVVVRDCDATMDATALKVWLLDHGQCIFYDMVSVFLTRATVNSCTWQYALLLSLGALTFARFVFKTLVVFFQTFILSGTHVCGL